MFKRTFPLFFLGLSSLALAQTWTVTTVQDVVDPKDGVTSLREAIIAANSNVDSTGRCRGVSNIFFSLPGSNAVATYGTTSVPYYKLKINYLDPDYAKLMGLSAPVPTPLPRVRCPINLDGYTQPGAQPGSPVIEISGEDLPLNFVSTPGSVADEDAERTPELLTLTGRLTRQDTPGDLMIGCQPQDSGCPLRRSASGSTIRGLLFNNAPTTALALSGVDQVTITGNYFGLDATGENPAPNGRSPSAVTVYSMSLAAASNNTIGKPGERNYFGAARAHALILWPFLNGNLCGTFVNGAACTRMELGSTDNVIQSNYFGLNRQGTRSVGGVCISRAGDRRLIGENGCTAGRTLTDAIYTTGGPQINFYFDPASLVTNSLRRNLFGGGGPDEGNVVVSSFGGLTILARDSQVIGNIFGLAADGLSAANIAPFFRQPLALSTDAPGNNIENNVITNSASFSDVTTTPIRYVNAGGILITGANPGDQFTDDLSPNVVQGNFIGVNIRGEHPGQNLAGLPATNAAAGIALEWMLPTEIENNVIAFNGYLGAPAITARATTAFGKNFAPRHLVVESNFMFCNGPVAPGESCGRGLGIDWRAGIFKGTGDEIVYDGPTLNDTGERDGPARMQNFPVLEAASGGVRAKLNSSPNTRFLIELFLSDPASATCVDITTSTPAGFTADPACGSSQFLAIQGASPVARREVVTDSNGNASFSVRLLGTGAVSATATRLEDGRPVATSEFSQAILLKK